MFTRARSTLEDICTTARVSLGARPIQQPGFELNSELTHLHHRWVRPTHPRTHTRIYRPGRGIRRECTERTRIRQYLVALELARDTQAVTGTTAG